MCDCIDLINARLAEKNSKLEIGFTFGSDSQPGYAFPALRTEKLEKRSRDKMGAIPTYCPFCGEKYRADSEAKTKDDVVALMSQTIEDVMADRDATEPSLANCTEADVRCYDIVNG